MSKNNDPCTTDLADFGARERAMLVNLLTLWSESGLPDGFCDDEVRVMLNRDSGHVFLTNSEYQAAMVNEGKLELWHNLPYSGDEGFLMDLLNENIPEDLHRDDLNYLEYHIEQSVDPEDLPTAWQHLDEV